ncbi:MAG TPA: BREX-1 system phosphatase PglZ type A [Sulfuricurvum sp.]|nr:MAG: TIGR02687 family protein [Campylobacterales bacterium 16-40-21]OZA03564.1 MAG: TIGR02687 family protein [Sulfuricurvum sp. 17-40-25]HQS65924.1 BREX-1 system phosphatase PglZ type A [Sulfuricurvum sp.]HQT35838.1 BREX-1 system phosphatase PglZ type A [Sulfuricurvum sp.]
MSKIEQTLNALFESKRVLFWYDNGGESKAEFESLSLPDVQKEELNNNEFTLKYKIIKELPDSKFLVYAPYAQPKDEVNWLLDLQISGHLFSADRSSLIASELGLRAEHKSFVDEYKEKFFNSEKRKNAFAQIIEPSDTIESLGLKMMSVAINCDVTVQEIILKTLENEKNYDTLQKLGLEKLFWKMVEKTFGMTLNQPTIQDFTYKLLQNHFYRFVDSARAPLNREAFLFVKFWMDSKKYGEIYRQKAIETQDALNIAHELSTVHIEKLLPCDTYELCDQSVVSYLLSSLLQQNIHAEKVHEIIESRDHTFWYSGYKNIYQAILYASDLLDSIAKNGFVMDSFDDGVQRYVKQWQQIDFYYRKFILHLNRAEHVQVLKPIASKIEDVYLNGYLRAINDKFVSFVPQYTSSKLARQRSFFETHIRPYIEKDENIFVIISDAMRYECGAELSNRLSAINRYSTKCDAMICSLPSFTKLGMASLLPHEELEIRDKTDDVFVDGKPSGGTALRTKILQQVHPRSIAISDEAFLQLDRDSGRAFVKDYNVIYVYHDEIDSTGDKISSEEKVFEAVESSFDTITRIIKQIAGFNRTNILITADHGFLYQNNPTEESEFCKYDDLIKPMKLNRRFIIGQELSGNNCTQKFSSEELGIKGENDVLLANSINKIVMPGGGNRFVHGSASLQELVIPLISIRKKRSDDVNTVNVDVMPLPRITTNSVNVSFYQEEPISDKVLPITLKLAFYAPNGELISTTHTVTFDSTEQDSRNREKRLKFEFKQSASTYSNETVTLLMKKVFLNSSEEPVYKEAQTLLKLSFFNDFDEL